VMVNRLTNPLYINISINLVSPWWGVKKKFNNLKKPQSLEAFFCCGREVWNIFHDFANIMSCLKSWRSAVLMA
jgi:hypothetical protein